MPERKDQRFSLKLAIVSAVVLLTLLIAGCSTGFVSDGKDEVSAALSPVVSSHGPTNGMIQSHNGGAVTIDMEWLGEENDSLVFHVAMDTHSVDLDQYNLEELAILRDDTGNEYRATSWETPPGGHHVRGTLSFTLPDSLVQGTTEYLEIIVQDVDGIKERVMRWEL
jgi:hypothetical protein